MTAPKTLSADQRAFLGLLTRAASCNPFSEEFEQLQRQIAGGAADASPAELRRLTIERWNAALREMQEAGITGVREAGEADRDLLRYAALYEIYHRYLTAFDKLIEEQIDAGERSLPVTFAGKALSLFARRGFRPEEARRHFAIMYQIRRAYRFIERGLVGSSACMKELRRHLWNNVFTHDIRLYEQHLWDRMEDFSTLLLGGTGSGKGTAAAAIGRSGFIPLDEKKGSFTESFMRGFVAINLSQYPETLIESELFGHRKGAFTGAIEDHEGVFARCSPHGAIFLDEIGDISVPVQSKLLQVLQERTFTPVGSHQQLRFRGRVIAATNRPLDQLRAGGQFRDDFYYRLCSDIITVPPLQQRLQEDPQELADLVTHFVRRLTGRLSAPLVALVLQVLGESLGREYPWPGNVRELEQAIRSILVTRQYRGDHRAVAPDQQSALLAGVAAGTLDADALLSGYCELLYNRHGTYEEVGRRTRLDRRTVKAYLAKRA